jgi:tetratricopeptide (TPR) repeat protein
VTDRYHLHSAYMSIPDAKGESMDHRNEIEGGVYGPAVQARDISGGIHVHQADAVLPTPRQLPPPVRLCGRDRDIAFLDGVGASRTVVISGPPGVGKTALAVQWGHARRDEFADGELFADLRAHAADGPAKPSEILGRFLRALGIRPQSVPTQLAELTALYRSVTSDRRIVVVLDDAFSAAQVRPLLPGSHQGFVLITSRWRLASLVTDGARNLQLDRLEPSAAVALLSQVLGDERVEAEPAAATDLAGLCEYFPLALSVSAARLAGRPRWQIADLVAALREEHRRLSALAVEDDMVVLASLDLSYRALPAGAARLYRLMGLLPVSSFDSGVVAAASARSRAAARESLAVLTDANLLDDTAGARYRFHDLIRLHALGKATETETEAALAAATGRMLDWYLASATDAGQVVTPYRHDQPRDITHRPAEPVRFVGATDALDWLDSELPNFVAVIKFAADRGYPTAAWQLVDALWPLFLRRGHYHERLELDRIGLAAARASGHVVAQAKMLNRLGLILVKFGQADNATECFRRALVIWREVGDDHRIASSLRRLGLAEQARGRNELALEAFRQALETDERLGEPRSAGLTLTDVGAALVDLGRAAEAIEQLRRAAEFLAQTPDQFNQARVLAALGRARTAAGNVDAAKLDLEQALEAMRLLRSPPGEAEVLTLLGDLAVAAGDRAGAQAHYQGALAILADLGAPATELQSRLAGFRPPD